MKNKQSVIFTLSLTLLFLAFSVGTSFGQPTDAQIKKSISGPKTVSVTLGSPSKVEWSSTYKKYMWTRNFTAKVKTETAGEFVVVKGYAAYDVMGGKYVYWRTFTSSNNYEGKKNPTVAELNKLIETLKPNDVDNMWQDFIGEIESIKLHSFPSWEWHTPNSVSFNIVVVHSQVVHSGVNWEDVFVDRVERIQRWRIYRDDEKQSWKSMAWTKAGRKGDVMRDENDNLIEMYRILERKKMKREQTDKIPRPTKVPFINE